MLLLYFLILWLRVVHDNFECIWLIPFSLWDSCVFLESFVLVWCYLIFPCILCLYFTNWLENKWFWFISWFVWYLALRLFLEFGILTILSERYLYALSRAFSHLALMQISNFQVKTLCKTLLGLCKSSLVVCKTL